ncbi:MAG: hydrogenase iron-sulfur subunit [Candidatus Heimdallarchaeota archaeon]
MTKNTELEMDLKTPEELRIGVFICYCGVNIGGFLDVPEVCEYAKTLPDVVFVQDNLYTCSDAGLTEIREAIKEHYLNRVVVASCTPATHEPLFRRACEAAGLNEYLFEMANIRDQCSWVHQKEWENGTEKAKDLVKMAVARARLLKPLKRMRVDVEKTALVIGGGVGGLTTAKSLANQGFPVALVEKNTQLGGMMNQLYKVYPSDRDAQALIKPLTEEVLAHPLISTYTNATIKEVKGYIGNFEITVASGEEEVTHTVGSIIVATGATNYDPQGLYGYGEFENVLTQMELETKFKEGTIKLDQPNTVTMIQCVGSRGQDLPYCSRICCLTAIKNAKLIKEISPETTIYILHKGIQTYGTRYEEYYRQARELGIRFVKLEQDMFPEVKPSNSKLQVTFHHRALDRKIEIDSDYVILSTPLIQVSDAKALSQLLKVPLGQDQFYFEAHSKLRPLDFANDGIYLCGTARAPVNIYETNFQALGAASRAAVPLAKGYVESEPITSQIDQELCNGCGRCVKQCPYGAITLVEISEDVKKAQSNEILCKGCGTCAADCPPEAIEMNHYTDAQIEAQIEAALEEDPGEKILAIFCRWCSYAGADNAGVSRYQYPTNVRIVRVMCTGRVHVKFVEKGFDLGAGMVIVSGCHPADCHYIDGNAWMAKREKRIRRMLEKKNINQDRFILCWIAASEGQKVQQTIKEAVETIQRLKPEIEAS